MDLIIIPDNDNGSPRFLRVKSHTKSYKCRHEWETSPKCKILIENTPITCEHIQLSRHSNTQHTNTGAKSVRTRNNWAMVVNSFSPMCNSNFKTSWNIQRQSSCEYRKKMANNNRDLPVPTRRWRSNPRPLPVTSARPWTTKSRPTGGRWAKYINSKWFKWTRTVELTR